MKKYFFSTGASPVSLAIGLLLLRLMFGLGMLVGHGWGKLMNFGENFKNFADPLGIGSAASFSGVVLAEVICAGLVFLGLFTRISLIPLIFTMGVAAFVVHGSHPVFSMDGPSKEMALLYLFAYMTLLLTGPGKYSLDQKLR